MPEPISGPITTEAVRPKDRFEYWRESLRQLVQLRPERTTEGPFRGKVEARTAGDLPLIQVSSAGQRAWHTRADIAATPIPVQSSYFITVQTGGECFFRGRGDPIPLSVGDTFILDPLREFELCAERSFRQLCVKLPRAWIEARVARPELVSGAILRRDHPISRLLAGYLRNTFDAAEMLTPSSAMLVAEHAVELLAQALDEGEPPQPRHDAVREALFVQACRIIALSFGDPDLNADAIARELGISTRLLQRIFAEREETVMKRLFAERLERAAKLLVTPAAAHRSITDIAFACGFNDSSHFGRAFAARMQMTPSKWRVQQVLS